MGAKNNRNCIICNKSYHYCPTCGADSSKPTWYAIFNNENCHDIYETCVAYRDKVITPEQAYEKIMKLDISDLESFVDATKAQIKEIIALHKDNNKVEKPSNKKTVVNNTVVKNK